jgi:hypothetical protein
VLTIGKTLSFHFDRLRNAGLVAVRREGRSLIYSARFETMMRWSTTLLRTAAPASVSKSCIKEKHELDERTAGSRHRRRPGRPCGHGAPSDARHSSQAVRSGVRPSQRMSALGATCVSFRHGASSSTMPRNRFCTRQAGRNLHRTRCRQVENSTTRTSNRCHALGRSLRCSKRERACAQSPNEVLIKL